MLAVDPARHNGRLGRQILEYTEDYARRRWGIKRMELDAVGTRKELIEWYERRGYVRTGGANPFPYGEGRDVSFLREGLDFKILGKDFDGPVVAGAAE
ncbi:GCN5-like N-acetyltransferase [Xylariales sp. PMI_506]|nr:GCN5-like N-acetyltransferase [Xylariales sp. PMI_506]